MKEIIRNFLCVRVFFFLFVFHAHLVIAVEQYKTVQCAIEKHITPLCIPMQLIYAARETGACSMH